MTAARRSALVEESAEPRSLEAAGNQSSGFAGPIADRDPLVERLLGGATAEPADSVVGLPSVQPLTARVLQRAQRVYGNRAAQQIVMRARTLQRQCDCGGTCTKCQEEEAQRALQRRSMGAAPPEFNGIPATPGDPLDPGVRQPLEDHFGADLTDVRVHTGPEAAGSATGLDALAYTAGRDIYFAQGMYAPSSASGQRLLAHEVAHVVQQSSGKEPAIATKSAGGMKIGAPDDSLESEAEKQADEFMSGPAVDDEELSKKREPGGAEQRFIQRQPGSESGAPASFETGGMSQLLINLLDSPDTLPEELYGIYFGHGLDVDKAADLLAHRLYAYVTTHPDPYAFLGVVFEHIPSRHEDNVAAAFVELLDDLQLNRFAASEAGRATLDMLYDAMITGDVSGFEREQAARIEQFGLAGAGKRQAGWNLYMRWITTSAAVSLAEGLVDQVKALGLDTATEQMARILGAHMDANPSDYAFVRQVFGKIPDDLEDNVAAEFVALLDNSRLDEFAKVADGRAVLDILYDALITGDVSGFERYEADRILQAKNTLTPVRTFEAYQQHRRILPVKEFEFFTIKWFDCYAPLKATLEEDGQVLVRYTSLRVSDCSKKFREDLNTFGADQGRLTGEGIRFKPDDIVSVRDYDKDEDVTDDMPALRLIDYSNQSKRSTLALGEKAFMLGLTLPMGGLPEAGWGEMSVAEASQLRWARTLAITDIAAWGISVVSSLVNKYRDWIAKIPYVGPALLDAVDTVDRLAGYYQWGRMGYDALHFAYGKLHPAWQSWHSQKFDEMKGSEPEIARGIDSELEKTLNNISNAEAEAATAEQAVTYVNEHPEMIHGEPGHREAQVGTDHTIKEESDPQRPGIHCKYHSGEGIEVDCPEGMGDHAAPAAELEGTTKPETKAESLLKQAELAKQQEQALPGIIEKLKTNRTLGKRTINVDALTKEEREVLEQIFPNHDLDELTIGDLQAARGRSGAEAAKLFELADEALLERYNLKRPYLRDATREAIRNATKKAPDGRYIDPDGFVRQPPWHYGHAYGRENRRLIIEAGEQGMIQEEFNDWVNSHPEWFRMESEEYNLSHAGEKPGID